MATFFIDKEKFFSSECPFPDFQKNIRDCELPVKQLIDRYNIKNKKVLSLGCGNGFEEFHFTNYGNSIVLSDADLPYGNIRPWVEECSVQHNTGLVFSIEDCKDVSNRYSNLPEFDVIYISSLHPDEAYRGRTQSAYIKSNIFKVLATFKTWPKVDYYSEFVTQVFSILKPGGIVIMQHYGFTVPIVLNYDSIPNCSEQLKKYGLSHIETWAFKRDSGNILNVYGKHMTEVQIGHYLESLNKLPQLTTMNGRYSAKLQNDHREIFRAYIQNRINFKFGYFGKLMPLLRQFYRAYKYQID
jgi:hypothetical protein